MVDYTPPQALLPLENAPISSSFVSIALIRSFSIRPVGFVFSVLPPKKLEIPTVLFGL